MSSYIVVFTAITLKINRVYVAYLDKYIKNKVNLYCWIKSCSRDLS
uniref:Uncharacterized protein n=1 Tax=Triparma laevis TaxID=1534972 RepID=A0A0K2RWA4_9STRA|nr:hypothetical protein AL373_pgp056 [Triparma laevis]BAS19103.1 hypothetical protein [Triparma laevis]